MEEGGAIRLGVSTLDPYAHAFLSVQAADSFNITLRQTAETSALKDEADRLYPGVDLKFRLMKESKYRPELSVGLMSAVGHKRLAGEYLALSKRYGDFDFTGGLGWGRYGTSGTFDNPLKGMSSHFAKTRPLDGEMPNGPEDWFTGEDIGVFGGIEYFTPFNDLSLRLDWGADRYVAEKTSFDFDAPDPWAVGIHYAPRDWIGIGLGILGGDKILATLSFQNNFKKWPGRNKEKTETAPLRPVRTDLVLTSDMAFDAAKYDRMVLHDFRRNDQTIWAKMDADPYEPMPAQLGHAGRHMANHAGITTEELLITPQIMGLSGQTVRIMRHDLEQALIHHQGSAVELWQNARLNTAIPDDLKSGPSVYRFGLGSQTPPIPRFRFILEAQTSLSEEDSGILYRTSAIGEVTQSLSERWMIGGGLRFNGPDNMNDLAWMRPQSFLPVRSNVDRFAGKTVSIDRLYNGWLKSFGNDKEWHTAFAGGYLEEMYAGFGGEILYRPYGKTYAFGAEAWEAFKRDPDTLASLALNGDHLLTGHLKAWYEIPESDLTLGLKFGRYLAEDLGGTLSLAKAMENGTRIEAFVTATDQADFDLFGGTTHFYSGLKFTLPFGNVPLVPNGSIIRMSAAPLGRDTGQAIDSPLPLYEMTEPLSYRHMAQHWEKVTAE